jgi:hypothetical protein
LARERNYRRENLASRYGISVDEYEQQLRRQNGKCAICLEDFVIGVEEHRSTRSPVIDHDHDKDFLRGILCQECNKNLGKVGDSLDGLFLFENYLLNPPWQIAGQLELDLGLGATSEFVLDTIV